MQCLQMRGRYELDIYFARIACGRRTRARHGRLALEVIEMASNAERVAQAVAKFNAAWNAASDDAGRLAAQEEYERDVHEIFYGQRRTVDELNRAGELL
jgi:hypothetical protein